MLTTAASHVAPRARALQTRQSAMRVLAPSAAALVRHRRQQTRGFRFGMLSWYLDPEHQHEVRRRHKVVRHNYAETIARRLSWEKQPLVEEARATAKKVGPQCSSPRDAPRGERYAHVETHARTPDNKSGVRPGQSIEDVERGAIEDLFFGSRSGFWTAPLESFREYVARQEAEQRSRSQSPSRSKKSVKAGSTTHAEDYVIDPISNRKVPKHSAPTPKDTVAMCSASAEEQMPIFHDGPPPPEELKKYGRVNVDHWPEDGTGRRILPHEQAQARKAGEASSAPAVEAEDLFSSLEDSVSPANPGEAAKSGGSRSWDSRGVFWRQNDGLATAAPQQPVQEDAGVPAYFPFVDSQAAAETAEAESKSLANGNTVTSETTKAPYDDLDQYKPVMVNENEATTDSDPRYPDLEKYEQVTIDAPVTSEPAEPAYEDLDKYTPVMEREAPVEQSSVPKYVDLDKYNAVKYNEPDGKPVGVSETTGEIRAAELAQYTPVWHPVLDARHHGVYEVASEVDPAELAQYTPVFHPELDAKPPGVYEAKSEVDPAELAQYRPYYYQEPDGKLVGVEEQTVSAAELAMYGPVWYNEPDGKPAGFVAETPRPAELGDYTAVRWNEPDGKPAVSEDKHGAAELQSYQAGVRYQEPDGKPPVQANPVQKALAEADAVNNYERATWLASPAVDSADTASKEIMKKLRFLSLDATEAEKAEDLDLLRASDVRAAAGSAGEEIPECQTRADKNRHRKMLESLMSDHQASSDAVDREASSAIRSVRSAALPAATLESKVQQEEREEAEAAVVLSERNAPVQTALDRQLSQEGAVSTGPMLYKILGYDAATQQVHAAETTSVAPDAAKPLAPAEVFGNLSQPAKFVPHIASLHAQGYEMVSGGGDVLVFRKAYQTSPSGGFQSNIGVRREEPVFSGPKGERASGRQRKPSAGKRILVGGVWVAAISYALGVVGEYFVSGGADGLGPRGL